MTSTQASGAPRDAATVVVLRDTPSGGFEVLLLRRHARSGFAASMWVFPGGTVDDGDASLATGFELEDLARRCALTPDRVAALLVAGLRETFEESGILFARTAAGMSIEGSRADVRELRDAIARAAVRTPAAPHSEEGDAFAAWVRERGIILDLDALVPFARWITPTFEPKRYDTLFFAARLPDGQEGDADRVEMTSARWVAPREALTAHHAGQLPLIYPTVRTLADLSAHQTSDEVLRWARGQGPLRPILPHVELDTGGAPLRILHPDDADYPWEHYRDLERP